MRSIRHRIEWAASVLLAVVFAAAWMGPMRAATPPEFINYQGVLRNAADHPVSGPHDMVFRFWTAATAGEEVLVDSHLAAGSGAVMVTGGLFNVALGSGIVADGSGPGTYISLADAFMDHGSLYLEVSVNGETLLPRTPVNSAPYSLNARVLDGRPASDYLDISAAPQTKTGPLTLTSTLEVTPSLGAAPLVTPSVPSGTALTVNGSIYTNTSIFVAIPQGTPPIVVSSTAKVENLNADLLDGVSVETLALATHSHPEYVTKAGDTMTGMLTLPNDGLRVGTTQPQIVVQAGHVGIGTPLPTFDLQVEGSRAGFFRNTQTGAQAFVGGGNSPVPNWGVEALGAFSPPIGSGGGGVFRDTQTGTFAAVGSNISKIAGNGSVSFIQNHPYDEDKVIVYVAPEGDETAVYTRGTARLVDGEARVTLGETFQWVANPDVGLTAYVTPRDQAVPLAVMALSPKELLVRGPAGSPHEVLFDYIVYGLRIGFEETGVVAKKTEEAFIPSMVNQQAVYLERPELRAFNALERFKEAESVARGIQPESIDLGRAAALKSAIGEYVPSVQGAAAGATPRPAPDPSSGSLAQPLAAAVTTDSPGTSSPWSVSPDALRPREQDAYARSFRPSAPDLAGFVTVSEPVGAGDVLVADALHPGAMRLADSLADPAVVGIVSGDPGVALGADRERVGESDRLLAQQLEAARARGDEVEANRLWSALEARFRATRAPVAFTGIVACKVDASHGAIQVGDLLTTSPTRGHAMRADHPAPGTVLGKALEPLAEGTGLIKVLVMLR